MFGKPDKKKTVDVNGQQIELQPKPSSISKLFGAPKKQPATPSAPASPAAQPAMAPKPQPAPQPTPRPAVVPTPMPETKEVKSNEPYAFKFGSSGEQPRFVTPPTPAPTLQPAPTYSTPQAPAAKPAPKPAASFSPRPPPRMPKEEKKGPLSGIIQKSLSKHPNLENAMRKEGMKETAYNFVKRTIMLSAVFSAAIGIVTAIIFYVLLQNMGPAIILGMLIAVSAYMALFRTFLNFPASKGGSSAKKVERDILFAARDLIIALRSGMPLFNAITSVSSGYGEASKEFLKIIEKVQLGTPLEDAIDQTVSTSKSPSFRKIMLQASVSIKVGADVITALQSIIDQLAQERVIELRRYGQRLNAIAMFYMLFGVILPSMGIAVLTILTTFIPIFAVNSTLLEMVVIGILFLQVVFLQLIRSSRPVFSM